MKITRQYRAVCIVVDEKGYPILDDDGAMKFEPHPELFDKLFASPQELHQHVRDIEARVSTAQAHKEVASEDDLDLLESLINKPFIIFETLNYF